MAKVSLDINGRKYALGCDEGEQERLLGLGNSFDERVKTLANQFGQIGDLRLLVMAGISLVDELQEVRDNLDKQAEKMSSEMRRKGEAAVVSAQKTETSAADALANAARRIERLAEKLGET